MLNRHGRAGPGHDNFGARTIVMTNGHPAPPSPYIAGLTCRCPACGKGPPFQNFLGIRPRCENCGMDVGFAHAGDVPAIFIMLFAGFIVVGAALWVEMAYQPPYWLH